MSISGVSGSPVSNPISQYFTQRSQDMEQLNQALRSGNLDKARQAYANVVQLAKNGPPKSGAAFGIPAREQDFEAIGQALNSGDLQAARQALASLRGTFGPTGGSPVQTAQPSVGDAVVTNLSGS